MRDQETAQLSVEAGLLAEAFARGRPPLDRVGALALVKEFGGSPDAVAVEMEVVDGPPLEDFLPLCSRSPGVRDRCGA